MTRREALEGGLRLAAVAALPPVPPVEVEPLAHKRREVRDTLRDCFMGRAPEKHVECALEAAYPSLPMSTRKAALGVSFIEDETLASDVACFTEVGWFRFLTLPEVQERVRAFYTPPRPDPGMPDVYAAVRGIDRTGNALADIAGYYERPERIAEECLCVIRDLPMDRACPHCGLPVVLSLMRHGCPKCGDIDQDWSSLALVGPRRQAALLFPIYSADPDKKVEMRHWYWAVQVLDGIAKPPRGVFVGATSATLADGMPV